MISNQPCSYPIVTPNPYTFLPPHLGSIFPLISKAINIPGSPPDLRGHQRGSPSRVRYFLV
eukprot:c11739_g1_i1 orf=86-268(+)